LKDIFACCPNKIYKLKSILISNQNMFRVQKHFLSKFPPLYFTLHSRRSKYFVFFWLGEVVLHGRKGVSDCFADEKERKQPLPLFHQNIELRAQENNHYCFIWIHKSLKLLWKQKDQIKNAVTLRVNKIFLNYNVNP